MKTKIRFCASQAGLSIEYHAQGEWRGLELIRPKNVEGLGGIKAAKNAWLAQNDDVDWSIVPPGDYHDEPGQTVTCI